MRVALDRRQEDVGVTVVVEVGEDRGAPVALSARIPVDLSMVGSTWTCQGFCGGSTPRANALSNATLQVLGVGAPE